VTGNGFRASDASAVPRWIAAGPRTPVDQLSAAPRRHVRPRCLEQPRRGHSTELVARVRRDMLPTPKSPQCRSSIRRIPRRFVRPRHGSRLVAWMVGPPPASRGLVRAPTGDLRETAAGNWQFWSLEATAFLLFGSVVGDPAEIHRLAASRAARICCCRLAHRCSHVSLAGISSRHGPTGFTTTSTSIRASGRTSAISGWRRCATTAPSNTACSSAGGANTTRSRTGIPICSAWAYRLTGVHEETAFRVKRGHRRAAGVGRVSPSRPRSPSGPKPAEPAALIAALIPEQLRWVSFGGPPSRRRPLGVCALAVLANRGVSLRLRFDGRPLLWAVRRPRRSLCSSGRRAVLVAPVIALVIAVFAPG